MPVNLKEKFPDSFIAVICRGELHGIFPDMVKARELSHKLATDGVDEDNPVGDTVRIIPLMIVDQKSDSDGLLELHIKRNPFVVPRTASR